MFSIEEFPEEPQPPPLPGPCHRDPPESPWGGSSGSSPAATPTEGGGGGSGGGDPPPTFRGRSRSAPPVLWAARKYGRELRRMSDEFQLLVLPRPTSVGGTPRGRWMGLGVPGVGGGGWREALERWWRRRPPR